MKTRLHAMLVIAIVLAGVGHGEEKAKGPPVKPLAEDELRSVLSKSLGYLAKEGDQWMTDKSCNSCHHMPLLLWGHREAKRRGFAVEPKKFDEWLEWSIARAADKKPVLEEAALMMLAMPERPAPELVKLIAASQKPDGTWDPAGQFLTMQKRGAVDARENFVRVALLALTTAQSAEAAAAHSKADAPLKKSGAPTSMESLVFRVAFARKFGKPDEAKPLVQQFLKQQRGDGGWSSFIGENMSDPLATGQVLYALQTGEMDAATTTAIAKAQRWLAKTQRADGSWPIDITHISKMDRSAPEKEKSFKAATAIYEYWGAAWATIGMLYGVPTH